MSRETTSKTTTIPGKNGGRLRNGGTNKGGPGRPPSAIRQRLRGSFEDRIKVLEAIADDKKASSAERLKALDLMAKYGLGTTSTSTDTEGHDAAAAGTLTPEEIKEQVRQILNGD